jgi:hypothetical protein
MVDGWSGWSDGIWNLWSGSDVMGGWREKILVKVSYSSY